MSRTTKKGSKRGAAWSGASFLYSSIFFVFGALAISVLAVKATDHGAEADVEAAAVAEAAETDRAAEASGAEAAAPAEAAKPVAESPPAAQPKPDDAVPVITPRPGAQERPPEARSRGTIVFVIDDVGHNTWQLQPFLALPGPLTLAVLPDLNYTRQTAAMIRAAGKELILHQPMEALNGLDAGDGAITTGMADAEIRRVIRDNLAQVPGAVGMNNHMGSKVSADVRIMSIVLEEASASGLYYLDSLTIGDSVVHSVASLMRLPAWERTVFLDNTPDKASMLHYIEEGKKIAQKRGYAIMIGHVWSAELAETLMELYPKLVEQGFSLSTISRVMMSEDDDADFGD